MAPLVTICIPTYNGSRYIRQCIESAIRQSYADLEILLVDDCSIDETVAILNEYGRSDPRIRISVNKTNRGLVPNWNRCVALAKGTWIKFLFQDDVLEPECVERMLNASSANCPLVICRRTFIFEEGITDHVRKMYNRFIHDHSIPRHFPDADFITPGEFCEKFLAEPTDNFLGEPTATLIHRSVFERFGYFNPNLVSLCDWEFWARIAVHTGFHYVDTPEAAFRVHDNSASGLYRLRHDYRVSHIDPLIVRHDIAYADVYAPLREFATHRVPPVNLIQQVLYHAKDVRLEAELWAYDPVAPDHGLLSEWQKAVRKYRRFNSVPLAYVFDWARRRVSSLWHKTE